MVQRIEQHDLAARPKTVAEVRAAAEKIIESKIKLRHSEAAKKLS